MHPFARYRKEQGLTQDDLARRLGVKQPAIGHYEAGTRTISAERAIEYERRLGGAVTRYELRPDLFGPPPSGAPADDCRCRETAA